MEYAAGGELFDRIVKAGRFSEDEARFFFQQLISGVEYCHKMVSKHSSCWIQRSLLLALQNLQECLQLWCVAQKKCLTATMTYLTVLKQLKQISHVVSCQFPYYAVVFCIKEWRVSWASLFALFHSCSFWSPYPRKTASWSIDLMEAWGILYYICWTRLMSGNLPRIGN